MKALVLIAVALMFPISDTAWAACSDAPEPGVDWTRCRLDGRVLSESDLSGARLRDTRFFRAEMDKTVLVEVDGYRSKFVRASMQDATLDQGLFFAADFSRADLRGASLVNADLRQARLYRADLRGADLSGALMEDADLYDAKLDGATWIDGERICRENSVGQCN